LIQDVTELFIILADIGAAINTSKPKFTTPLEGLCLLCRYSIDGWIFQRVVRPASWTAKTARFRQTKQYWPTWVRESSNHQLGKRCSYEHVCPDISDSRMVSTDY